MTYANDLTFLFLESFFMVIRLPCLSAYAFGSRVAFTSAHCIDILDVSSNVPIDSLLAAYPPSSLSCDVGGSPIL
jgi:hypothetical protein